MSEHSPGWKSIERYSDFEEAMRPDGIVEMLRSMMEEFNSTGAKGFVMFERIIAEDGDQALFGPTYEGELVGVEGESDEAILILKDVATMQAEDAPDPEVIKYTVLEQFDNLRVPVIDIENVSVGTPRLGEYGEAPR